MPVEKSPTRHEEEETQPSSLGGQVHLHQLQTSWKSTLNSSPDLTPMVKEVERSIGSILGTGVVPRPWQQMGENTILWAPLRFLLISIVTPINLWLQTWVFKVSYASAWSHDAFPSQEGRVLSEHSTTLNSKVQRKNEIKRKRLLVFIQARHVLPQPRERLKLVCIDEDKYQHRVNNHWHPKVF